MERVLLVVGLAFGALAFGAPSVAFLNQNWRNHYHSDFKVQWALSEFHAGSQVASIAEAIYHLHSPQLRKNEQNYSPNFYSFTRDLIRGTNFNPSECNASWMAFMRGGVLSICPGFFNQSIESRVSNLFHEASHGRSGDPGHVTCEHGTYQGKPISCDSEFTEKFDGSGYNHQFMYLWWVRDASSSHELSRDAMTALIRWLVLNQFNKVTNAQVQRWAN